MTKIELFEQLIEYYEKKDRQYKDLLGVLIDVLDSYKNGHYNDVIGKDALVDSICGEITETSDKIADLKSQLSDIDKPKVPDGYSFETGV